MKLIRKYYRTKRFIDIGWEEFGWLSESFLQIMGIMYFLENALGIIIKGYWLGIGLITLFVFFYNTGKWMKRKGIYDTSEYVIADIDPVTKEILEAARLIKNYLGERNAI